MHTLLDELLKDEKKNNRKLYSSGPYWDYKNSRTTSEIKKKGLKDFRGLSAGIGTSFADNLVLDVRNELNIKGKLVSKIFSFPLVNKIFNEQLKITKNHLADYVKNISIVYKKDKNVLRLIDKYSFKNTTNFGCITKFRLKDKEYSNLYIEMANRIDKLSDKFDFGKIFSFFEIGGGFGANVHFLLTNFPNIKKIVYLDTAPNIYVGTEYLRSHFGEKVKDYLDLRNFKEITFSKNNELEIFCIPPWDIERLNVKIDHFHNAASFVEMPDEVVKNYCKYIEKCNTNEISLITYDEYDQKTTFNPELLNIFFENKLIVSKHSSIIEQHDRKLIFLTSK